MDDVFNDAQVISSYPLQQAIDDGILVTVFDEYTEPFISKYSDGKPVVATAHLFYEIGKSYMNTIWNKFIAWRQDVKPTLPEEDQMFSMEINGKKVWVIEDDASITFMFPEDY